MLDSRQSVMDSLFFPIPTRKSGEQSFHGFRDKEDFS